VRILGYAGVLSYTPLTGCAPLTVNFKANNVDGVAGFIYDFGDGTTASSTGPVITHVYTKPGPHVPKVTLTDNLGCYVTSPGIDTIKVDGVYSGFTFSPFPACDRGAIQFMDTSHGAYSALNPPAWRFHDATTSSLASPSKTYAGPGTYAVTLYSSTVTGCKDTMKGKVTFHPLPIINAGKDTTICLSDSALLEPSGGVSYTWLPAATLSCSGCTTPYAFPAQQTRYLVIGTDENGCTNKDSVTVSIRTKVTATVSPGTEICSGKRTDLLATGGGTYEWSPPTGLNDPYIGNPIASPMVNTKYMVITRLASCTPDTDYVDIIVHPTPVVDAGKDQTMIAGNAVQLKAVGSDFITTWTWTPEDGLTCTDCSAPEAAPKRSTTYVITASTEFNCSAVDSVRVTVLCDNGQVYIPNTFTPEGNGVNDVFYPRGRGLQIINRFRIYNRWGEVVFERNNMQVDDRQQGWDGKKDGRLLSPDVYVYTVEAICDNGEPIRWQGDVMLLR
jgi:gliding motility-associated-like protein